MFPAAVLASGKYSNVSKLVQVELSGADDRNFERGLNWILDGVATHIKSDARVAVGKRTKSA